MIQPREGDRFLISKKSSKQTQARHLSQLQQLSGGHRQLSGQRQHVDR